MASRPLVILPLSGLRVPADLARLVTYGRTDAPFAELFVEVEYLSSPSRVTLLVLSGVAGRHISGGAWQKIGPDTKLYFDSEGDVEAWLAERRLKPLTEPWWDGRSRRPLRQLEPVSEPSFQNYLAGLPGEKSYTTPYRLFCDALAAAGSPWATVDQLDRARRLVASRRDMLVGRGRRRFSPSREGEVSTLASIYQSLMGRLLALGWQ